MGGTGPKGRAEADPDTFRAMWGNVCTTVEEIQAQFQYRSREAVYIAARRLGLPRRDLRGRPRGVFTEPQRLALQRARSRIGSTCDQLTPLQHTRIAEALAKPVGPFPTAWRCACGGASDHPDGHPHCRRVA